MSEKLDDMMRFAGSVVAFLLVSNGVFGQEVRIRADATPSAWNVARVVEELRIGSADHGSNAYLGIVVDLAVARDGRMLVADGRTRQVKLFAADGSFIRNVGRPGIGPGEYRQPWGVRFLQDGRIAVWDPPRLVLFSETGEALETKELGGRFFSTNSFVLDGSGNFYFMAPNRSVQQEPGASSPIQWLKYSPGYELLDSIPIPQETTSPSFGLATGGGRLTPFTPGTFSALAPDGELVTADNREGRICVPRKGMPDLSIVRETPRIQLTDGERAEWEAWAAYFAARGNSQPVPIPRTKPPFRGIAVDEEGRIWLDRYVAAVERPAPVREAGDTRPQRRWVEPRTFEVISQDGEFLGTVVLPPDTYAFVRRGDVVWGTERGEGGTYSVVRLRLRPRL